MKKLLSLFGMAALVTAPACSVVVANTVIRKANSIKLCNNDLNAIQFKTNRLDFQSAKIFTWDQMLDNAWDILTTQSTSGIDWSQVSRSEINMTFYDDADHILTDQDWDYMKTLPNIYVQYSAIRNVAGSKLLGRTSRIKVINWNDSIFKQEINAWQAKNQLLFISNEATDETSLFNDLIEQLKDSIVCLRYKDIEVTPIENSIKIFNKFKKDNGDEGIIPANAKFKVVDHKTDTQIMELQVNFGDQGINSYVNLYHDLSNATEEQKHMNIQNFKLIDMLPGGVIDNFPAGIKKLASEMSVQSLVNDLLNPNNPNGYAHLLPKVMPKINGSANWIDNNPECVNFTNALKTYFSKNYNLNIANGDLSYKDFMLAENLVVDGFSVNVKMNFDFYNVLKNLIPDFIHFHNYLSTIKGREINYLLEFLKYLSKPVTENFGGFDDGFKNVNSYYKDQRRTIVTNFDNLLHDLLVPFKIGNNDSGLNNLINISIIGNWLVGTGVINFDSIDNEYYGTNRTMYSEMYDALTKVITGSHDILQPDYLSAKLAISLRLKTQHIQQNLAIPMLKIHEAQIRDIITHTFGLSDLKDSDIQITKGQVLIQYRKAGDSQWLTATSVQDLFSDNSVDLRIMLKNMDFVVKDKMDPNLYVKKTGYTMYIDF